MTKRLLLAPTLALAASASAFAQQAAVLERRNGDLFVGHVRTARVEMAKFVKQQDGSLVEGPRTLSFTVSYSGDGRRSEREQYAADGKTLRALNVIVYDDAGRMVEQSYYSGRDQLIARVVTKPEETLNYDGEGKLRQRIVRKRREDGSTDVTIYNGDGSLYGTSVIRPVETGSASQSYDENGMLRGATATLRGPEGAHVQDEQRYDSIGAPSERKVSTAAAGANEFESVVVRPDGTQGLRTRETRERDPLGNVVKSTMYVWDKAALDFVPSAVFYYTVTYYR